MPPPSPPCRFTSWITEAGVRAAVIKSLGELRAASAYDLIQARLDDGDANVRRNAIIALTQLGPNHPPELLTKLTASLTDQASAVRVQSAIALGRLGYPERVLSTLAEWLNTKDEQTRIGALEAIGQVDALFHPSL